jgi:hypothetical protein
MRHGAPVSGAQKGTLHCDLQVRLKLAETLEPLDYESEGREFESLRARHWQTQLETAAGQ